MNRGTVVKIKVETVKNTLDLPVTHRGCYGPLHVAAKVPDVKLLLVLSGTSPSKHLSDTGS